MPHRDGHRDDFLQGEEDPVEPLGVYLPAGFESRCLVFPFEIMSKLPAEVLDRWLHESYWVLADQLAALQTRLASSCSATKDTDVNSLELPECGSGTESDRINEYFTRSQRWSDVLESWCVAVPALVGQVRQLGKRKIILRGDARVWEAGSFHFRHYLLGMNGFQPLERKLWGDFRLQLTAAAKLGR